MSGGYRPSDATGVVEVGETIYVARLPMGPIVVLEGVSALIWVAACQGSRETLVQRVSDATDAPADVIAADVVRVVEDLVSRGLLVLDGG